MTVCTTDQHDLTLGSTTYWFRTPTPYDLPKMRRLLTKQGVRRPTQNEFRVAALAGVRSMATIVDQEAEGEAQCALIEEWYKLVEPIDENAISEPDGEKRAAIVAARDAERREKISAIYADIMAIEANLERHHPPYAELVADGRYWDDVSRIEAVRLLLVRTEQGGTLPRDRDDLVDGPVYIALPEADKLRLGTFGFTLLAPGDAKRKN